MSNIQRNAENVVQKGFENAELAKLKAENAAGTVGRKTSAATQTTAADVHSTVDTVKYVAHDAANTAENKAETTASTTEKFEKDMAAKTNVAVQQGKADVHDAKEKVQDTSEGLIGQAKGIVNTGLNYGQDYVHQVQADGFIPATKHAATDAYAVASNILSSAAATVQPHIDSAKQAISSSDAAANAQGYGSAIHERAGPVAEEAKNTGASYATQAQTAITDAANKVSATTGPYLNSAQEKAAPYVEKAQDAAAPYVQKAQDAAAPYVQKAQDAAAPYIQHAQETAGPNVRKARGAANEAAGQGKDAVFGEPKTSV